jgi:hypothetical protein
MLLAGFVAPCLLQIRKIATILRQSDGGLRIVTMMNGPVGLSRRLDSIAIGAARHDTVLQLACGRKVAGEPDSDREQDNGNDQPDHRAAPVIAIVLVGIGHWDGTLIRSGRF